MKQFIKSFKPTYNHLYVLGYDLLFHIIVIPLLLLGNLIINDYAAKVNLPDSQEALLALPTEQMQLLASQTQGLVFTMLGIILVLIIAALLSWSLSRGLIYTKLMNKKLNKNYFKKFIGLNLILGIAAIILITVVGSLMAILPGSQYIALLVFLAIAYFGTLIYISFTKNNQVFNSIGQGLSVGVKKIGKLILPLVLIFIVFIIFNLLISLLPPNTFISLFLMVIIFAWSRVYFIPIAEKLI